MSRMASADIMCVGPKSVKEKFTGIIRFKMIFNESFTGVESSSTMFFLCFLIYVYIYIYF